MTKLVRINTVYQTVSSWISRDHSTTIRGIRYQDHASLLRLQYITKVFEITEWVIWLNTSLDRGLVRLFRQKSDISDISPRDVTSIVNLLILRLE